MPPLVAALLRSFGYVDVGRHVRADGEYLAEHAGARPVGDPGEAGAVAEHVAQLDMEVSGLCGVHQVLEGWPIVAGGLVQPDVLASVDGLLGHGQALVVAAFDGHGYDARVFQESHVAGVEPCRRGECAGDSCGGARCGVRLPDADRLHVGIAAQRLPFARGVAVACTDLTDSQRLPTRHGNVCRPLLSRIV